MYHHVSSTGRLRGPGKQRPVPTKNSQDPATFLFHRPPWLGSAPKRKHKAIKYPLVIGRTFCHYLRTLPPTVGGFWGHSEGWDRMLCIVYRLYYSVVSSVCVINMRHYRDTINLGKWGETETGEAGAGQGAAAAGWNKYTQLFIYLQLQQSSV